MTTTPMTPHDVDRRSVLKLGAAGVVGLFAPSCVSRRRRLTTTPSPRLAPVHRARDDLDPSLAFDVSEFGHLGYDPKQGQPDPESPVQDQYRGTWSLWTPPNGDPRVGEFLADKVVDFFVRPRPEKPPHAIYLGNQRQTLAGGY